MKKTNIKRIAAFTASILAVAALAVPMTSVFTADAATENTITISGETAGTHEYSVYKIFSGTVTVEGEGEAAVSTLEGIDWAMTDSAAFLTALKGEATIGSKFTDCDSTAASVAKVISGLSSTEAKTFANFVADYAKTNSWTAAATGGNSITLSADGYYVIVESTFTPATDGTSAEGAYTAHILGVYDASEGAAITVKSGAPEVIKKVEENVKSVITEGEDFAGVEDYDVGTQYNDVADYCIGDAVSFKLYGTLPDQLAQYSKYKYVFHDTLAAQFTAPAADAVKVYIDSVETDAATVEVAGQEITVTFNDIIAAGASSTSIVTVEYDAILSSDAVIGLDGQKNSVYLTYSNNPNWVGTGAADDYPSDDGKTPVDEVIVFTYELDVTKVDGANTATKLEGAEFQLYNEGKTHVASVTDGKFVKWVAVADAASDTTTTLTSDANGEFKIVGLDDGTYYLKETKEPDGYNILTEDVKVVISATTANNQVWDDFTAATALTDLDVTVTQGTVESTAEGDVSTGIVAATITNNSGSTLPSTGGIGTTLFYVGGGALALGAGVLLVSKKRMANK